MFGWDLVEEVLLTEAATSYTFSGLNGDVDEEYRLVALIVNGYDGGCIITLKPNNDSTANIYGYQYIRGINTAVSAGRNTQAFITLGQAETAVGVLAMSDTLIHAKSGYVRTFINTDVRSISTTTVTGIVSSGWSWNNTADNITSLVVGSSEAGGLGVGTHLFLMKKRTTAGGCWKLLFNQTLTGAATTVTIPDLNGDTSKLFQLKARTINAYNGTNEVSLLLNIDTGNNYGMQFIEGSGTGVVAARYTAQPRMIFDYNNDTAQNQIDMYDILLYAKSGVVRAMLLDITVGISTTTVANVGITGGSWNNTANNITSIAIQSLRANGFATGTVVELWGFSLSEAYTKAFTDDAFAITDAKTGAMTRPVSDTATITEMIGKAAARTVSDIMTITDAINRGFGKTMAELFAISDTIVRRITRSWAEIITITEVGAKAVSLFIEDTITVTDSVVRAAVKILTDSINISDVLSWAFKWLRITHVASAWTKTTKTVSTWAKSVKGASIWQKLNR